MTKEGDEKTLAYISRRLENLKEQYADVMKEVTEKSDKKNENGHINIKI